MHFFILEPCATPEKHESQGVKKKKKARSTILRLWQQNFHVCTRGPHIMWKNFFLKNLLKKELLKELYHFIKSK